MSTTLPATIESYMYVRLIHGFSKSQRKNMFYLLVTLRQVIFKLTSVSIKFAFKITLQVNVSPVSDVNQIKAKYLNSRLVTCKFPEKNFYAVAVSNDGIRVSEYVIYIIYDSHCHHCNNSLCITWS